MPPCRRGGRLRLITHHEGVTPEQIQAKTGFQLTIADSITTTKPPTEEELYLLREKIDPLGTRRLETLSSARRRKKLLSIVNSELSAAN